MCMRKITCEVYLSTPHVGYGGSPSTVNETNCNNMRSLKKKSRKSAISYIVLEKLVLQLLHLTHDEDGF